MEEERSGVEAEKRRAYAEEEEEAEEVEEGTEEGNNEDDGHEREHLTKIPISKSSKTSPRNQQVHLPRAPTRSLLDTTNRQNFIEQAA